MTQEYTPVAWQDETTSQQGTLINAERLNQMQTAHHFADGLEEVDAIPTADPGVSYHKIVYCTADSTIYRWDGTEWTKDIDDETKALLQQEIARATAAEGGLAQDIADEATARETADTAMQADISALESGKLDKKTASPNQWQVYGIRGSSQIMINAGLGGHHVPLYGTEEDLLAKMPTLGLTDNTVVNYGWATAQIGAEATARADADTALGGRIDTEQARAEAAEQANAQAIANTYTKAEIDTALAGKASTTAVQTLDTRVGALETGLADTYNKSETDALLASKADDSAVVHLAGAETIPGAKTFTNTAIFQHDDNNVVLSNPNYTAGTNPSSNKYNGIIFRGSTATSQGWISHVAQADGATRFQLRSYNMSGQSFKQIEIFSMADGTGYATAPSRGYNAGSTYSNDVATIGTLDAYSPMVRTSGNQTIYGQKSFENNVYQGVNLGTGTVGWRCVAKLPASTSGTSTIIMVAGHGSAIFNLLHYQCRNHNPRLVSIATTGDYSGKLAAVSDGTDEYLYINSTSNHEFYPIGGNKTVPLRLDNLPTTQYATDADLTAAYTMVVII